MPILDNTILEYFSRSPDQTRRLGMRLGGLIVPGQLICLSGELGAGKTTLMKGIAQGWGSPDPVTSPTFVLVNEYHRPGAGVLFHLDAYRLSGAPEGEDLDIEEMLSRGTLIVEWPEKIETALPKEALYVRMNWMAEEQRGLIMSFIGDQNRYLIDGMRKLIYGAY